jgi:hypothetical protein
MKSSPLQTKNNNLLMRDTESQRGGLIPSRLVIQLVSNHSTEVDSLFTSCLHVVAYDFELSSLALTFFSGITSIQVLKQWVSKRL